MNMNIKKIINKLICLIEDKIVKIIKASWKYIIVIFDEIKNNISLVKLKESFFEYKDEY